MITVYIGFSSPTTWFQPFADLIRWIEARPYDHVYIRFQEPATKQWIVFQASKEMVNIYNKDIFQQQNTTIKEYEISINLQEYSSLWLFVLQNLGIPYSLLEDFGIVLMKIFKLKAQPFNQGLSAEFCSKLGANVCELLQIYLDGIDPSSIDPSGLDSLLASKKLVCINNPTF